MIDATLKRIWDCREAISRRCGYDSRRLIQFYRSRRDAQDKKDRRERRRRSA